MVRLNVLCFAIVLSTPLTLTFCHDEPRNIIAQNNLENKVEATTLKVSFYCDTVWVDSIIHVKPLAISNVQRFFSPYPDSISNMMQKQIFELKKVNSTIEETARMKLAWVTRLVHESDTTKEFGLYFIQRQGLIRENRRFRFNEKNQLQAVNDSPMASGAFVQLSYWNADTIAAQKFNYFR